MKTDKQTYSFRDGDCKFTVAEYTLTEFDNLSEDERWTLVQAAVKQWRNHTAPRKTKDKGYINDGKTFDLASIAADLARETRESGPTEKDIEGGMEWAAKAITACPVAEVPEREGETPEEALAAAKAAREAAVAARKNYVIARGESVAISQPWSKWAWDDALTLEDNCIALYKAWRMPKPQPKKIKAKDLF